MFGTARWMSAGAVSVCLLASLFLARALTASAWSSQMDYDRYFVLYNRADSIREHLDAIAAIDDTVIVLGQCYTEVGFSPQIFDKELVTRTGKRFATYNLALGATASESFHVLVQKVVEAFEDTGKRPALMMVELTANEILSSADYEEIIKFRGHNRSLQMMLRDWRDLGSLVFQDLVLAATQLRTLVLGGESRALTAQVLCNLGAFERVDCLARAPHGWPWPADARVREERELQTHWFRIRRSLRERYGPDAFGLNLLRRGSVTRQGPGLERDVEIVMKPEAAAMNHRANFLAAELKYIQRYEDPFQSPYLQLYFSALRELQSIGAPVVVYTSPKSHLIELASDDESWRAKQRLIRTFYSEASRRIRDMGIDVVELDDTETSQEAFGNVLNLLGEDTGQPRFSRAIADRVAPVLLQQNAGEQR